jgi:hypothetical protein
MLTRTVYGHYEDVGLTPPWRRSRRVSPAASALSADSHRNRWVCRAAPCRTPTIYATATSMKTFSPKRINTHTTPLQYTREIQIIFSMIIETKTYNMKVVWDSVVKLLAKWNFKRAARVRRIGQNLVKSVSNEIEAYTKRNSKRMVRMDSPCRGSSFSCRTHASTIHGCGTIKGLWGSCLEEGERNTSGDRASSPGP